MLHILKSKDRHFNDFGWLQTYWLFSFSNYHDPENISHGRLRVFNDDIVAAKKGFDTHPHDEIKIVSIVLDGEMVHEDTMGNKTMIRKNDLQRMTAGTGLYHSERNLSDKPVCFFKSGSLQKKGDLSLPMIRKDLNRIYGRTKLNF